LEIGIVLSRIVISIIMFFRFLPDACISTDTSYKFIIIRLLWAIF